MIQNQGMKMTTNIQMQHWKQKSLQVHWLKRENSWVEPRDVTSLVRGKEPLAAPPGNKGEATEQGPVMYVYQAV